MTFPLTLNTDSPQATEEVGRSVARAILADAGLPHFVALFGDLGVGKTAFVRGFADVVTPGARVKSPTFALVNEYKGKPLSVFHFDMYRISGEDELYAMGFYDYADRPGICLVEWSENIEEFLPERYLRVEILKDSVACPDSRSIRIDRVGQ